tara:strand:+ start:21 stop:2942 length:2922 start_codon:yes stop_codon:yes gene_type:complete
MNDWDKILADFAHKCGNGGPDMTNPRHLALLRESLLKFGWKENATNEFLGNLREKKKPRRWAVNDKNQVVYRTVDYADSKGWPPPTDDQMKAHKEKRKAEKGKKTDTQEKWGKRKANDDGHGSTRWDEDDNHESIEERVSSEDGNPRDKNVRTKEQVGEKAKKHRRDVFEGKSTGKGGGDTTAQEEMANISREIAAADGVPNHPDPPGGPIKKEDGTEYTPEEWESLSEEEKLLSYMQDVYPKSKFGKRPISKSNLSTIKKSTSGAQTMKRINENKKKYDYRDPQDPPHPINTTDTDIVKDTLLNNLEDAEGRRDKACKVPKSVDCQNAKRDVEHYKEELYWFQRKATGKDVTGKEGNADTMMIYQDENGNMRVLYVTNKQGEDDTISNSTVETTKRSLTENMDERLDDEQQKEVVGIAEEQAEKATEFNKNYTRGAGAIFNDDKKRKALISGRGASVLGKAATSDRGTSGRKQFQKEDPNDSASKKRKQKYIKDSLLNPQVRSQLVISEAEEKAELCSNTPEGEREPTFTKDCNLEQENVKELEKIGSPPTPPGPSASDAEKEKYKEERRAWVAKAQEQWTNKQHSDLGGKPPKPKEVKKPTKPKAPKGVKRDSPEWEEYLKQKQEYDIQDKAYKKYKGELKDWKKKVAEEWERKRFDEGQEMGVSDGDILVASGDATGEGETTGVGSGGSATPYTLIKATDVTSDIRARVKKCMGGDESKLEECAKKIAESTDPNVRKGETGDPLYGGKFDTEDVLWIMNSKELEELEKVNGQRNSDLSDMYFETTDQLREEDQTYWDDHPEEAEAAGYIKKDGKWIDNPDDDRAPDNGPNEQSYISGFLERCHFHEYLSGEVDDREMMEAGPNSHDPERFRDCLAELTDAEKSIGPKPGPDASDEEKKDYMKKLESHLKKVLRAGEKDQQIIYVPVKDDGTPDEQKVIGTDTHRTAGRGEKMAGQYGTSLTKCLKEKAKS